MIRVILSAVKNLGIACVSTDDIIVYLRKDNTIYLRLADGICDELDDVETISDISELISYGFKVYLLI